MADQDDEQRLRASQLGDRTVIGGAPVAGGGTMASSGAFDTVGGGDLGGPGSRDPGDATSDLRDPVDDGRTRGGPNEQQDALRAQAEAQGSGDASDAGGLQDQTRGQARAGSANNDDSL
jgi:hypothetical protein